MMKFLVTGGGGYIGFHISLKLLELGHQVSLLDISYPSKKWDTSLSIIDNEEKQANEIHCSFGKMEFIKGKTLVILFPAIRYANIFFIFTK